MTSRLHLLLFTSAMCLNRPMCHSYWSVSSDGYEYSEYNMWQWFYNLHAHKTSTFIRYEWLWDIINSSLYSSKVYLPYISTDSSSITWSILTNSVHLLWCYSVHNSHFSHLQIYLRQTILTHHVKVFITWRAYWGGQAYCPGWDTGRRAIHDGCSGSL